MGKKKKATGAAAIPTYEEPAKVPGSRVKTCPGCKASLPFPTRKCPNCGQLFGKQAEAKQPAATPVATKAPVVEKKADSFSALLAANEFAGQVGGVNEAIALLETVKKIKG